MHPIKLNQTVRIKYVARNRTTGLSDVKIDIWNNAGTKVVSAAVMTEQGTTGTYYYDYTPTTTGTHDFAVDSVTQPLFSSGAIVVITETAPFHASIPPLERPTSVPTDYKIRVNLEDTEGNPEDPDAQQMTVNVEGADPAESFRLDMLSSGVANLSAAIALNSITVNPKFRYNGKDATGTAWPADGYGADLIKAGAGTPTLNAGSPLLGADDDSVRFPSAAAYYQPATVAENQFGAGDFIIELIADPLFSDVLQMLLSTSNFAADAPGIDLRTDGSDRYVLTVDQGVGAPSSIYSGFGNTRDRAFDYIVFVIDRDEASTNGGACYVNGKRVLQADLSSAVGSLISGQKMTIGAQPAGGFDYEGGISYLAAYEYPSWFQGGAGNLTEWDAFFKERALRLFGFWPERADGTEVPEIASRDYDAYLRKVEADGTTRLYRVGDEWPRLGSMKDTSGDIKYGYNSEPERENLFTKSIDLSHANWTEVNNTTNADSILSPTRFVDADAIVTDDAVSDTQHGWTQAPTLTADAYALSAFAHKDAQDWLYLSDQTLTNGWGYFDLNNGVPGNMGADVTSFRMDDLGNGWYFCAITFTGTAAVHTMAIYASDQDDNAKDPAYVGDGVSDEIHVKFPQIEKCEFSAWASSPIETDATTETRAGDYLRAKGDDGNLGGVGSNREGVLEYSFIKEAQATLLGNNLVIQLSDGAPAGDYHDMFLFNGDLTWVEGSAEGGAGNIAIVSSVDGADGDEHIARHLWLTDDSEMLVDGVSEGTDVTCIPPDDQDQINIGCGYTGQFQPGGLISQIRIYPRKNLPSTTRNENLLSTAMTRLGLGRYEAIYRVDPTHDLEELIFEFSYLENAVAFIKDRCSTVIDASEVGFSAEDRASLSAVPAAVDALQTTVHGSGSWQQALVTGSTLNKICNANSAVTVGSVVSGTYASTALLDSVYWQIADTAGEIDMYFEFLIDADGVPTSVSHIGRMFGLGDDLIVEAYDWGGTAWEQIGVLIGKAAPSDETNDYVMFSQHVGTGPNLGKVRVRFRGTGLTAADLYTDQIVLSYSVINRSVGYANGAIWVDTINGTAGSTIFINGTGDNPVDSWADALLLSAQLGIRKFHIVGGSSIILTANSDQYEIEGAEYNLLLNGQSIANAYIIGADISGTSVGLAARFIDCRMETASLIQCGMYRCGILSEITLLSPATYLIEQGFSGIAGTAAPSLDFGGAVGDTSVNFRHYSGGIEVKNMGQAGADTMSLEGQGELIINANCVGGTIVIRGDFTIVDNAGGAVTIVDAARYDTQQIRDSMKLAPTAGAPAAGSVDEHLDDIETIATDVQSKATAIDARLPSDPADESNQLAAHNTTQGAIAALNNLSQGDVQAAMTAQGYSPARASKLDNLDATVGSRAVAGDAMALTSAERTTLSAAIDVVLSAAHDSGSWVGTPWTVQETRQIRGALGLVGTQETPAGGGHLQDVLVDTADLLARLTIARAAALDSIAGIVTDTVLVRKILRNRLVLSEGSLSNWVLYDDDGTTPLLTWNAKDKDGLGIALASSAPVQREPV